ncbi:MAG: aryl-sulfate sulfotransferase [Planctomycetes bacterium]|nr:aryl-sulfate sulfotransferase [Planctomycetota bacterium]
MAVRSPDRPARERLLRFGEPVPQRFTRAALAGLALCLALSGVGCRQDDDATKSSKTGDADTQMKNGGATTPSQESQAAAAAQTETIKQLSAMGYLDFSEDKADKDRIGVVLNVREKYSPGYNLYSAPSLSSAFLIDQDGKVIQSWKHEHSRHWTYCELFPNGDLLVPGMNPFEDRDPDEESNRYLLRLSWDGKVIWKRRISAHHDVELTPNGKILTLTDEYSLRPIHRRLLTRDTPPTLLSQDGQVIGELSLYDAFDASPAVFKMKVEGIQRIRRGVKRSIDLFHANSIEWMPHKSLASTHAIYSPSNVLVCLRHQNAVAILNWDDKKLLWAWGPGELLGPHDASMLPSGHILIFDNGFTRGWSRVIELDPLARRIVWEYKAPTPADFYTITRGGAQRLPNGNTLITNSNSGQAFEVTPEGERVWEFLSPHLNDEGYRATIVRMNRYEPDYIDRILRSHAPADLPRAP